MASMSEAAWHNPAIKQWRMAESYSNIGIRFCNNSANGTVDPTVGSGSRYWTFEASTYIKHKTSTLWGEAGYVNGTQHALCWNETSDPGLIYPYFTADSVGGDLRMERYSFAGGYADRSDRWTWGVQLNYVAGLYYRNVDPRPRNVTGKLDLSAGMAYRTFSDYFIGISAGYCKYKQTNDITFKSQMGVEKIYHTTGLGSHYTRFAGSSTSTYYTGNRIGAVLNCYPSSGRGFFFTADISRFAFNKILTDLNKLPLNHVEHEEMLVETGFKHIGPSHDWAVTAKAVLLRRNGSENIFGDASSSVYPKIGSLDMYSDKFHHYSISALWQWRSTSGILLWISPSAGYIHRNTTYVFPISQMIIDSYRTGASALFTIPLGNKWRTTITGHTFFIIPRNPQLKLAASGSPNGLIEIERIRFHFLSRSISDCGFRFSVERNIWRQMNILFAAEWNRRSFCDSVHSDCLDLSLSLNF